MGGELEANWRRTVGYIVQNQLNMVNNDLMFICVFKLYKFVFRYPSLSLAIILSTLERAALLAGTSWHAAGNMNASECY